MDGVDLEVLRKSAEWLDSGKRVLLVTVVKTWGSSPRPPGALLAVREDGIVVGSVSGGCIEDDIVERSRREGAYITRPQAVTYGVSAEDARKFGLPCGGTIQLVLEPLTQDSRIRELLDAIEQGKLVARKLDLDSAAVSLATVEISCPDRRRSRLSGDGLRPARGIHGDLGRPRNHAGQDDARRYRDRDESR
jgi:xanthine dehydrogenase accessory factor